MRRPQQPAFANPVLIGAVTVLVAIVAVFLAYNANNGLPFVPTRQLKVDIPNGSSLVPGNDVEEGGFRIGIVSDMHPIELANGTVGAQVVLQLNTSNGRVPVDSTATIRPRSLLGLKYVDLNFGNSKRMFPDGGTLPVAQTNVPVQFDDINKLFDAKTRPAIQREPGGLRRRADRARVGAERHDREPACAVPAPAARRQIPVGPEHTADALLRRAERLLRHDLAGRADERAAVRRPGDDVRGDLA